MTLRSGITTGTCAAAAAKAAATLLAGGAAPDEVAVSLPGGGTIRAGVVFARATADGATAAVRQGRRRRSGRHPRDGDRRRRLVERRVRA